MNRHTSRTSNVGCVHMNSVKRSTRSNALGDIGGHAGLDWFSDRVATDDNFISSSSTSIMN